MSDPITKELNNVVAEFQEIAPSLVGMSNALSLPELSIAIQLAELVIAGLKSELSDRGTTPQAAKEAIDDATQAAILSKFGGK